MMKWFKMTAAMIMVVGLSACTGGDTPDADASDGTPPAEDTSKKETREGSGRD